jgi:hypothetical protein
MTPRLLARGPRIKTARPGALVPCYSLLTSRGLSWFDAPGVAIPWNLVLPFLSRSGRGIAMAGGVMIGVLRECHEDHIVLANGTKIFLTSKQSAGGLSPGTSLTVAYTAKRDGRKVADNIWSGS